MGLWEHLAWTLVAAFIVLGSGALIVFGAVAALYGAVRRYRAKHR
jgi:hypothetical protein